MEGPLEESDVAQKILKPVSKFVARWCVPVSCQNHYWKIRPSRLGFDAISQSFQTIRCKSLLNNDAKRSAVVKLST